MRRLRRWLLNALTALSLLLCVAMAGLWVRSYVICDNFRWFHGDRALGCATSRGALQVSWIWASSPGALSTFRPGFGHMTEPAIDSATAGAWVGRHADGLGFHTGTQRGYLASWWTAIIPLWFVGLLAAAAAAYRPSVWWKGIRQRLRRAEGKCAQCGYDVRASPDRCPECGTAVVKGAT